MKDYEWCQNPTATVGAARSIIKSTTQVVDELMALEFAEAGKAPTSPTLSSQIRPNSAFYFHTQSPQPASDGQILTMDNTLNATTPSLSSMAFPSRPDLPSQSLDQPLLASPAIHKPTSPSPVSMVAQSPVAIDAPPSSPCKLQRKGYDDFFFMKCKECKMIHWASNDDGKALCCLCMEQRAQVSRHCNYAAN